MRTHLIAETGASGEVVWVWMKRPGQPTARPVTPAVASRLTLDHTEISGAPRSRPGCSACRPSAPTAP